MNLQLPPHYCKTDVMRSVLVHADCFDVFPYIADKSVNLILCDLPYGTTACKWDSIIDLDLLWKEYKRIIKDNGAIVLTASQPFTTKLISSNYEMFKYELIWNKCKSSNFMLSKKQILKMHENILVFYANQPIFNPATIERKAKDKRPANIGNTKIVEVTGQKRIVVECKSDEKLEGSVFELRDREYGLHPTQKPLELMKYLIKTYSNEDDIVMDNCMGSNTTGLACKELNRQYIGIEKDKNYYDVSVSRVLS